MGEDGPGHRPTQVEVDAECLTGPEHGRFQLAVSTGFRTSLVESGPVPVPRRERRVEIRHPMDQAEVAYGHPILLAGAATSVGADGDAIAAYWTSNRDGFLGDGFRVLANRLSPGQHVLTLTVEEGSGGEVKESIVVRVRQNGDETSGEKDDRG